MISEIPPDFRYHKKPSGQDAHLAEIKLAVNGTARARRMRRAHSLFCPKRKGQDKARKSIFLLTNNIIWYIVLIIK